MTLPSTNADREFNKFGEKPSGQVAVHTITTIDNAAEISGGIILSWTREVLNISTTPVALNPNPNQVYIRVVPLVAGNFYYGPDNGINSLNSEVFSKAGPIEITINGIVYIVKESGSGDVVVYRGSST